VVSYRSQYLWHPKSLVSRDIKEWWKWNIPRKVSISEVKETFLRLHYRTEGWSFDTKTRIAYSNYGFSKNIGPEEWIGRVEDWLYLNKFTNVH
jgi:hypothetical protein